MRKRFTLEDIQRLERKGIVTKGGPPQPEKKASAKKAANSPAVVEKKSFIMGIDPDVDRCGVAIKESGSAKILDVKALHFYDVLNLINRVSKEGDLTVYVDAGWLVKKSNWHRDQGANRREKIARNVGECHRVGKLICTYLSRKGIDYHEVMPTKAKVTSEEFKRMNLWKGRINQDCRDAVMLIFCRS